MIDRFPGIAEGDARGELAATFADIRATIGVPVVNFVWRHLATIDGGLDWAWRSVRPLYVSGDVFMLAGTVRAGLVLPGLGSLVEPEPAGIDAVLASYDHSNTVNLVALSALLADARAGQAVAGHAAPLVAPRSGCRRCWPRRTSLRKPGVAFWRSIGWVTHHRPRYWRACIAILPIGRRFLRGSKSRSRRPRPTVLWHARSRPTGRWPNDWERAFAIALEVPTPTMSPDVRRAMQ